MDAVTAGTSVLARRPLKWLFFTSLLLAGGVATVLWWFTEPLDSAGAASGPSRAADAPAGSTARPGGSAAAAPAVKLVWPREELKGEPAKRLLLEVTLEAERRISGVSGYQALFTKRERIKGKLLPEQRMKIKVRHEPFSVYLKFLEPRADLGKEVVYATGRHEGKLIGHFGGISRRLLPRLSLPVDHAMALADSRHPITDAGLKNLIDRLVRFRRLDLGDRHATTILTQTDEPDGKKLPKSIHEHAFCDGIRPFARVEIVYDPDTWFPIRIDNYDWPAATAGGGEGSPGLAESYRYDDIKLDSSLTDIDFDPANPEYEFRRF